MRQLQELRELVTSRLGIPTWALERGLRELRELVTWRLAIKMATPLSEGKNPIMLAMFWEICLNPEKSFFPRSQNKFQQIGQIEALIP